MIFKLKYLESKYWLKGWCTRKSTLLQNVQNTNQSHRNVFLQEFHAYFMHKTVFCMTNLVPDPCLDVLANIVIEGPTMVGLFNNFMHKTSILHDKFSPCYGGVVL